MGKYDKEVQDIISNAQREDFSQILYIVAIIFSNMDKEHGEFIVKKDANENKLNEELSKISASNARLRERITELENESRGYDSVKKVLAGWAEANKGVK
jgi:hypothetical protein